MTPQEEAFKRTAAGQIKAMQQAMRQLGEAIGAATPPWASLRKEIKDAHRYKPDRG